MCSLSGYFSISGDHSGGVRPFQGDFALVFQSFGMYSDRNKVSLSARTSGSLSEDVVNHLSPFVYPEKGILMKFTLACLILLSSAAV